MKNVTAELDTVRDLVISVLKNNVATRDNDTLLYVECCKKLGAKTLNDVERLGLSIISVHKIRQKVQNIEGLYKPSEKARSSRSYRRLKIRDYMRRIG